ncbi:MAG: ribonuclease III [Chloroflexi bacterium]|nr:ribonuclease III [Chloroflexota bacterium]
MLELLQNRLAYQFQNPDLLEQALTHRSYLNENLEYTLGHNERLEFLGDSVIGFIAGHFLFAKFPSFSEGYMTRLRAGLVRTETLADFGKALQLGEMLKMAKGEIDSGGRIRRSLICDAFEAVVGAMYLDSGDMGLETIRNFLVPLFEPVLEEMLKNKTDTDAKTLFQEWSQSELHLTPVYRTITGLGPEHDRSYVIEVTLNNIAIGWGNGRSKQAAEQDAARQAMNIALAGELLTLLGLTEPPNDIAGPALD